MKQIIVVVLSFLFVGCSGNTIEGEWKLTAWRVDDGFDINNDGVVSINILDEIDCVNNEVLVFESNGVMSSKASFNPEINIALENKASNTYRFEVICDTEGVISFASSYSLRGDELKINEQNAILKGNQIYRVFKKAIKIYNKGYTQIVGTKDLTLVYTKR